MHHMLASTCPSSSQHAIVITLVTVASVWKFGPCASCCCLAQALGLEHRFAGTITERHPSYFVLSSRYDTALDMVDANKVCVHVHVQNLMVDANKVCVHVQTRCVHVKIRFVCMCMCNVCACAMCKPHQNLIPASSELHQNHVEGPKPR
jgi:hypothetical protein